jgi:hypothetical protein
MKKLRLVPVEVFGAEDGYGLSDAVEPWSGNVILDYDREA